MPPGLRQDIMEPKTKMRSKSSLLGLLTGSLSQGNVLIWPDDTTS